jgi:hypothetical protein
MLPKAWRNDASLEHASTLAKAFLHSVLNTACSEVVLPPRQTSLMDAQICVALCTLGWSLACEAIAEERLITKDWLNRQIKTCNRSVSPSAKRILLGALRKYMTLVFKYVGAPSEPIQYTPKEILRMLLCAEAQAEAMEEEETYESD